MVKRLILERRFFLKQLINSSTNWSILDFHYHQVVPKIVIVQLEYIHHCVDRIRRQPISHHVLLVVVRTIR